MLFTSYNKKNKTIILCNVKRSFQHEGSVTDLESVIDAEQREYRRELQEHQILQDAMQGSNLLGMMIEDKPKFGRQSDEYMGDSDDYKMQMSGVNAVDLFIDPMSVFGSERHPALQEVLKQLDNSKKSRGEVRALEKKVYELRCKAR